MIDSWPILGKFAYLKMLATVILRHTNVHHNTYNIQCVVTGTILHKMKNIQYARCLYTNVKIDKYRDMCVGFMSANSMSLIVDAKGQHNDCFNQGGGVIRKQNCTCSEGSMIERNGTW